MKKTIVLTVFAALLTTGLVGAQDEAVFKTVQLTDQIYQLITDEGAYTTNVLVFVGDDGLLLVDANTTENAEELKKVVESFGKGIPKYIINTHRHVEHVGGNAIFGPEPIIIAHDLVKKKLQSGGYIFDEFPEATFADITLTDSLCLYFNGEKIRIIALPGSHDDNEIIVHFTNNKVVHLSSLVNGLNFPSVDKDGDVLKFPELVAKAMTLLPHDVTIVSGHNANCTWADLGTYHDMLVKTTAIVKAGLDAGKDVATMQQEKVLAGFEAYAGSYVSPEEWIDYLATGFAPKEHKERIYEPLYYALKDGGPEAAVKTYYGLKNTGADKYEFTEVDLLVIGDKLANKKRMPEAIEMLKLSLKEYPESAYNYYTYYILSSAYKETGKKEPAMESCQKALELKPDFKAGAALLEEIKKM